VLDEPNANLDAIGEQALIRSIQHARGDGAIVILIAHRPAIMQVADKLLVLENGRITQFRTANRCDPSHNAGRSTPRGGCDMTEKKPLAVRPDSF
jgi:ATP-binding cassette subfamily C protein